ncbi:MAG: sterol desaturase family protein [Steroidobacteraceae bacterium]
MNPTDFQAPLGTAILLGFIAAEIMTGGFRPREAGPEDDRVDLASLLAFPFVATGIFAITWLACETWWPGWQGAAADWPWWALLGALLIGDDLTHYWWHRLCHTSRVWPLHRAHHSAAYMSVRLQYRNSLPFYLLMPGLWIGGLAIYLGFGWAYVAYTLVKLTVIMGAHCSLRWDEKLYQWRYTRPLMWLVERVISTPATHHAHHALSQDDGIGHYTGNYGNLLFFWDILFGTAVITRRYPPAYGLADDRVHGSEKWYAQLYYPLFTSRRAESVLTLPPGKAPT